MITKDNAKQLLPLVQAMAEGKTIQVRGDMGGWFDVVSGCLTELRDGVARYRIKPEPKLRPWKPEEVPAYIIIRGKIDRRPDVLVNGEWLDGGAIPLDVLFTNYVRISEDGTERPCGVLCEGEEHGEA